MNKLKRTIAVFAALTLLLAKSVMLFGCSDWTSDYEWSENSFSLTIEVCSTEVRLGDEITITATFKNLSGRNLRVAMPNLQVPPRSPCAIDWIMWVWGPSRHYDMLYNIQRFSYFNKVDSCSIRLSRNTVLVRTRVFYIVNLYYLDWGYWYKGIWQCERPDWLTSYAYREMNFISVAVNFSIGRNFYLGNHVFLSDYIELKIKGAN